MVKNNNLTKKEDEEKYEENKLLKGILLACLDGKERREKAEILKKAGFNKFETLDLCGPSETTLRTRKHKAKKKQEKQKGSLSKIRLGN